MSDRSFLAFSLGPVQSFIGAARTVRDLWTGSYLLSWLTFHAMKPVLERRKPDELIFPDMRANPLWQREESRFNGDRLDLLAPCLPNRFLAEVPEDVAVELARKCEQSCRDAWADIAETVRKILWSGLSHASFADDSLWQQQVRSFFEVRTVVLPWTECGDANRMRQLLGRADVPLASADDWWKARWQLVMKLLAAARSVRHFPTYRPQYGPEEPVQQKCTLLGTYEHLGPGEWDQTKDFWARASKEWSQRGSRTGPRERLCAVSLARRFAWPLVFHERLGRPPVKLRRFSDTATVAATRWLNTEPALDPEDVRDDRENWSGQWLHWSRPDQDTDDDPCPTRVWDAIARKRTAQGKPPTYYAILMMDVDRMGDLLANSDRARQRTISETLADFSLRRARQIVECDKHAGELIYAGGDDVLAVLPTESALACAVDLRKQLTELWLAAFPKEPVATVSAGVAVVHYKEDLRFALDQARKAEKAAKDTGRDALQLAVCRRSGEHSSAACPWDFVDNVAGWVTAFGNRASDRWAYHLKGEMGTLSGLDLAAMQAEVKRQVGRAEEATRKHFVPERMAERLGQLRAAKTRDGAGQSDRFASDAEALGHFLTLCQSASFLARGKDA